MTFEQLVPNQDDWIEFHLNFNQENDRVTTDPALNNVESQSGWTYVYVVNNRAMYIGNTGSVLLSKRVGPELNKSTDDFLMRNVDSKLAYTNIRISKQLQKSLLEPDGLVVLRAYPNFWLDPIYHNGQMTVGELVFDMDFLLRWSPRSIQGSQYNPQQISMERALILNHINFAEIEGSFEFLPPWNLGLG